MHIKKTIELIPREYKRKFYFITFLNIIKSIIDLIGLASLLPLVIIILDNSIVEGDSIFGRLFRALNLDSILEFSIIISIAILLWIPIKSFLSIWISRTKQKFLLELYSYFSNARFNIFHRKGLPYIKKIHSSELSLQINGICYGFSLSVVGGIIDLFSEFFLVILLGFVAFYASTKASLLLAVSLIPLLLIYFFIAKNKIKQLGKQGYELRRKQVILVQDSLRGYASATVNGSQRLVMEEFNHGLRDVSKNDVTSSIYSQYPTLIMQIGLAISLIIIMFIGDFGVNSTSIFVLFGFIATRLMPSFLRISNIWNALHNCSHILDAISQTNEEHHNLGKTTFDDTEPISFNSGIRVDNISFSFEDGTSIINNFSLFVKKGEIIGIKGKSGSGKSTLFNLLLGLYSPNKGEIYIDEILLEPEINPSWHKIVGYAEQEVFISTNTLAHNISLSKNYDKKKMLDIIRMVGLQKWFDSLSDGLNTIMDEQGANLSGGEKQRIGVARVLYKNAQILFLDETTSALDSQNEENIISLLHGISRNENLTIFIISHRESTLKMCDRVINMEDPS